MKTKNPLRKLTLVKTTVAHLDVEQMTAARGGSCGYTWESKVGCTQNSNVYTYSEVNC